MRWIRRLVALALLGRMLGPNLTPRFRPPQTHPWRIPGRTVYVGDNEFLVRETGPAGAPPVLLIHGLAGSSLAEWYQVGKILADGHRVILVDNRGHGLSPQSRGRFEVEEEADEIVAILDMLDCGEVTVVGYSLGGTIAQSLAHRHPGRVRALVLIATFSHHPSRWRLGRILGQMATRGWERLTGAGTPEVRSVYLLATRAVAPEHARWLWEETHRRDPDSGAQAAFAMLRFDSREWIGRLGIPTTVVIPTRDQLVPTTWQYSLAAAVGDARVVEVSGARHELPWTHPDLVAAIVSEAVAVFL